MEQKKDATLKGVLQRVHRNPTRVSIAVLCVCFLLLTIGMVLATSPKRYNLSVGDIAPETITATKDVVDEISTELKRELAAESVPVSYKEDVTAIGRVLASLETIFDEFEAVRAYGESLLNGSIISASGEEIYDNYFPKADLEYAAAFCTSIELSSYQLQILMKQRGADIHSLYINTADIVRSTMESTIREGQLESAISSIQRQLLGYTSSDLCWSIAVPAVRACLEPNLIIDQEATEANREAARLEVEPIYFKSGQNIAISGERVTSAQLAVLGSLGLLEGNLFDIATLAGVCILGVLAVLALIFYALQFDGAILLRIKNALILAVILIITMGASLLVAQLNIYLAPVSMAVLLVAALLSPSLAYICNMLALILVGVVICSGSDIFMQQMLKIVVSGMFSAPVGIYITQGKQQRASILYAGVAMAVVNLLSMLALGLLTNSQISTIVQQAVWSAGSNVLASLLCMGVQPVLEGLFDIVTPYKLLELANPNQPLLRRLLVETPGTYHHSIMVANLSEAAAEAIGADALLTRVGSYYHDVGKIKRPLYFKENQIGDNPHDRTDPRVSAAIISEHVQDGILLGRQYHLPEAIIDFIAQHHGDTLVGYFYHKMLNMEGGEDARQEDFRYPGPRPRTRETAIVMLADTAEAAVRAGGNQAPEVIEKRIQELIKEKIDSGQLNDSPLCFADVQRISYAFAQVLTGLYHKRIEYPKLDTQSTLPIAERAGMANTEIPVQAPEKKEER